MSGKQIDLNQMLHSTVSVMNLYCLFRSVCQIRNIIKLFGIWFQYLISVLSELGLSISCKIACVLSEDTDRPAHPHILIKALQGTLWITKDPKILSWTSKTPAYMNLKTDLSFHWLHMQSCRTCYVPAHILQNRYPVSLIHSAFLIWYCIYGEFL